jgi:hypothetical protein
VVYDRLSRGAHQVTVRATDEIRNKEEDGFLFTVGTPEQLQRLQGDNNNKKGHFLGDSCLLPHALGLRVDKVPRKTLIATQRK